jgi:hypothetical protein
MSNTSPLTLPLIITTGDISDVDGFMALDIYARQNADVLFIMNYPSFFKFIDRETSQCATGLGYEFGVKQFLKRFKETAEKLGITLTAWTDETMVATLKDYYNEIAADVCATIWDKRKSGSVRGNLYFGIGGVNDISPFAVTAVKNDADIYNSSTHTWKKSVKLSGDNTFPLFLYNDNEFKQQSDTLISNILNHERIYMDFNGSAAFLEGLWRSFMIDVSFTRKLKAAFVMGGIHTYGTPQTSAAIPGVLNRFACATMNQLYAPQKTRELFLLLDVYGIPVFTVSNNVVVNWAKTEWLNTENHQSKSDDFNTVMKKYYTKETTNKPFDVYSATALVTYMTDQTPFNRIRSTDMFVDDTYGATLVSNGSDGNFAKAFAEYAGNVIKKVDDAKRNATKSSPSLYLTLYNSFLTEISELWTRRARFTCFKVRQLTFDVTEKYEIKLRFQ